MVLFDPLRPPYFVQRPAELAFGRFPVDQALPLLLRPRRSIGGLTGTLTGTVSYFLLSVLGSFSWLALLLGRPTDKGRRRRPTTRSSFGRPRRQTLPVLAG